jgi:KaiC/GvpD/RAD55 family RecA-like ATPase
MKDIKELIGYLKKAPKDFIVLINVRAENYLRTNIEVLRVLANEDNLPGVYITINKPYVVMKRILEENKIKTDKLYFVDCITKTAGGEADEGEKNVFYMDSPQNLTGLGVAMGEAVRAIPEDNKFLFMDSLSTLLLYHNSGTVAKFSHFLTGRMRMWGLRGILISIEKEADPQFTSQLAQFCDTVVSLDEDG